MSDPSRINCANGTFVMMIEFDSIVLTNVITKKGDKEKCYDSSLA